MCVCNTHPSSQGERGERRGGRREKKIKGGGGIEGRLINSGSRKHYYVLNKVEAINKRFVVF